MPVTRGADRSATVEVQAELDTLRMKTASPVEPARRLEIVPLDAHTDVIDVAVKLAPAVAHTAPRARFRCCCVAFGDHARELRLCGCRTQLRLHFGQRRAVPTAKCR